MPKVRGLMVGTFRLVRSAVGLQEGLQGLLVGIQVLVRGAARFPDKGVRSGSSGSRSERIRPRILQQGPAGLGLLQGPEGRGSMGALLLRHRPVIVWTTYIMCEREATGRGDNRYR